MFVSGLTKSDAEPALGAYYIGAVPNNSRLVREAIDRGIPLDEVKAGNNITTQLKKLMLPQADRAAVPAAAGLVKKLSLALAK
jgi:pilus assembly protein CpaE